MREVHGYHGEHRRHARDALALADNPVSRSHDAPKQAARDSLKIKMLDPAVRVAEHLRHRKVVDEAYKPKHAAEQLKPQEAKPEQAPPETRDKPASKIDERTKPLEGQREDRRTPERSRLPKNDTAQMVAGYGIAFAALADAVNILPGKWDAVLTGFIGAAVGTVAWANRRWKEKHGHRPED